MFFEIREYRMRPGMRDEWVRFMEGELMPYMASKGNVICASFVGEQEKDLYIWIRRFEDDEERERQGKEITGNDHWKNDIMPRIRELLDWDKTKITRVQPTKTSVLR